MNADPSTAPRLLLLSNSRDSEGRYLEWAREAIRDFLGRSIVNVVFIPYATVRATPESYATLAREAFEQMGYSLTALIGGVTSNPAEAIAQAEAIVVGGGNTFQLLATLQDRNLVEVIRSRVGAGVPYIGWSAGAVIAAPTIGTTNDMPIVEPKSLRALGIIPFQINAHYTDHHPPGHQGETRAERLEEYVAVNRATRVLGLREGCSLRIVDDEIALNGVGTAPVFQYGAARAEYSAGDDISFLLRA
jgi:dipeptidase E